MKPSRPVKNMAEASFLAAREARNSRRPESASRNRKEKQEGLHDFWSSIHSFLKDWNDRLTNLASTVEGAEQTTDTKSENEKRQLKEGITRLAMEIQIVRKICLSTAAEATAFQIDHIDDSDSSKIIGMIAPPPEGDLPLPDARLLHRELTECQTKLDQAKSRLLPKGKFVFRRYREAVRKREEKRLQEMLGDDIASGPTGPGADAAIIFEEDHENSVAKQPSQNIFLGTELRTLQNLEGMDIVVDSSGRTQLKKRTCEASRVETETFTFPSNTSNISLRNLRNCIVSLQGSYKSVHMTNIHGSSLRVTKAIDGPTHVTQCHTSIFYLSCQQLRLHESTDLTVQLPVAPVGIILEDCNSVVFQCNASESDLDIKDFAWLRSGTPSPNFTVEAVFEDDSVEQEDNNSKNALIAEHSSICVAASSTCDLLPPASSNEEISLPAASNTPFDQKSEADSDDEL